MNTSWERHAQALADRLRGQGDIRSDAWYDAVRNVPRHEFVPHIWQQGPDLHWTAIDTGTARGLDLVYSPVTLITKLADGRAVSSSTKPDLMVRMLEFLDVRDGQTVLEIGTGSGYNAALLSRRLGAERVTSVDVDAELVELARTRLARLGFDPAVMVADGEHGFAARAPYDRIIATCSVAHVPDAWIDQLVDGGLLLATVMPSQTSGNLAVLRRRGERLEGHFSARPVSFMAMRHLPDPAGPESVSATGAAHVRVCDGPGEPWRTCPAAWFWASLRVPGLGHGYVLDAAKRAPTAILVTAQDGSRAEVALGDGPREVSESGPQRLWQVVEEEYHHWRALGEPAWEQLGLTVTRDHQWVWLHDPHGPHRWALA